MKAKRVIKRIFSQLPAGIRAVGYEVIRGNRTVQVLSEEVEKGIIFIHIPKNAGVSISKALFGARVGHRSIKKLKLQHPYKEKDLTTFGVKRNPYDRLLSAYSFLKKGGMNEHDKKWASKNLQSIDSFEEFVYSIDNEDNRKLMLSQKHFAEQVHWIEDFSGNVAIDKLIEFEELHNEFNQFTKELGINVSLSHRNSSQHKKYKEEYNTKMKKIVYSVYERDFESLGYEDEIY